MGSELTFYLLIMESVAIKRDGHNRNYPLKHVCADKCELLRWFEWLKMKKGIWQRKGPHDGFIRYSCNSLRQKKMRPLSESLNCEAKLRLTDERNERGPYTMEYNRAGYGHLMAEVASQLDEAMECNKVDYERHLSELLNLLGNSSSNSMNLPTTLSSKPSSSNINDVSQQGDETNGIAEEPNNLLDGADDWEKKVDELAKLADQLIHLSNTEITLPFQNTPPEVISVAKTCGHIDWQRLAPTANLKMVFARITLGCAEDPEFRYNFKNMLAMDFLKQLGAYHYFLAGKNAPTPEEQFQAFVTACDAVGFNRRKHLVAIAVQTERNVGFIPSDYTARLIKFINLLAKNGFMRPIIYCNNRSWNTLIDSSIYGTDDFFSRLPLWIANWRVERPEYPATWKSRGIQWWAWHYTDRGEMEGCLNPVYFSTRNVSYAIKNDGSFHSAV